MPTLWETRRRVGRKPSLLGILGVVGLAFGVAVVGLALLLLSLLALAAAGVLLLDRLKPEPKETTLKGVREGLRMRGVRRLAVRPELGVRLRLWEMLVPARRTVVLRIPPLLTAVAAPPLLARVHPFAAVPLAAAVLQILLTAAAVALLSIVSGAVSIVVPVSVAICGLCARSRDGRQDGGRQALFNHEHQACAFRLAASFAGGHGVHGLFGQKLIDDGVKSPGNVGLRRAAFRPGRRHAPGHISHDVTLFQRHELERQERPGRCVEQLPNAVADRGLDELEFGPVPLPVEALFLGSAIAEC